MKINFTNIPSVLFKSWTFYCAFTVSWWTFVFNQPFFERLFDASSVSLAAGTALALSLAWLACLMLLSLLPAAAFRLVLICLYLCGTASFIAASNFGIALTPDMARNFLSTDYNEASGYLSFGLAVQSLLCAVPGIFLTLIVDLPKIKGARSVFFKLGAAAAFSACAAGVLFANLQALSSLMRENKGLRYFIAPFNAPYAVAKTNFSDENPDSIESRIIIEPNPVREVVPDNPTLVVFVVGETSRAANWQASGYNRETTPLIMKTDAVHFTNASACGTSTDVSVPCMMSHVGRSNYDRGRILNEEMLPSLIQRSGWRTLWIDNQSGCKGACLGIETKTPAQREDLCPDGVCRDEVLLDEVDELVAGLKTDTVAFLHLMGSHGPAYYKRSAESRKRFGPECESSDFAACSEEQIRNAYDNSVLETDFVLASIISRLEEASKKGFNTALFFVSDHGESLGENEIFLHGAPYLIAPKEQIQVPMMLWTSSTYRKAFGIDMKAVYDLRTKKTSHDAVFGSMLDLLRIKTEKFNSLPSFVKKLPQAASAKPTPNAG